MIASERSKQMGSPRRQPNDFGYLRQLNELRV